MLPSRRNTLRIAVVLLLLLLLFWWRNPVDHLAEALSCQEMILSEQACTPEELTRLYDRFGIHMDELSEADREKVWRTRRAWEARKSVRRLDDFFRLDEKERNAWLDAELAKRADNDRQQREEQQQAARLPNTSTYSATLSGPVGSEGLDAASRQVLDSLSAEDRAKIIEYERLYYERLTHKR